MFEFTSNTLDKPLIVNVDILLTRFLSVIGYLMSSFTAQSQQTTNILECINGCQGSVKMHVYEQLLKRKTIFDIQTSTSSQLVSRFSK